MSRKIRIYAADCETDPFKYKRDPEPFVWGVFGEGKFLSFRSTKDFCDWIKEQGKILVYFHNGGKFDVMFLLTQIIEAGNIVKAQVINGRIVKIHLGQAELRDSYSAVPEPLRMFGKKEIEYWKLEKQHREKYWQEILEYLEQDCVSLYELMIGFREIAGKKPTIASCALAYCKNKSKIDPGKTNHNFDRKFRPYYYGGRTECFRPGIHKNIRIIDIRSAYPFSMLKDHPTGEERIEITKSEFDRLDRSSQERCFITLECETKFGCFPRRNKNGGLEFPICKGEFFVTGWEYIAAVELNLICDVKFREIITFAKVINFTPYIMHWYREKASHDKNTEPVPYLVAKRMMNALYGKMAQDPARYYDYMYCPAGTTVDREDGWELAEEYKGLEIHRRPSLYRYEKEFGSDWKGRPLYNNVATGASITGATRAHLLRAMHTVGFKHIIYCDTDSLMISPGGDISKIPMRDELGNWELEGTGLIGYFGGKKLYGIEMDNKKPCTCGIEGKPCKHHKMATKGSKLTFDQIIQVLDGKTILWENAAPSFSLAGRAKYVARSIRLTANKPLEVNI